MTANDRTPRPPMSFVDNTIDRQSTKRTDAAWIESRLQAPDAGIVLSTATQLILDTSGPANMRHGLEKALELGALREEMVFLGQKPDGSDPLFATCIEKSDEEIEALDDLTPIDLRTLAIQGDLSAEDTSVLAQARAMIHWHRTHKFCSRCGHPSNLADAGYRRECPSCGGQHFPRTDACVIMLIIDENDRALLGRPPRLPEGIFTTLAGFMEPGETVEQAVRRETMEEAGISVGDVWIRSNQPWPFPSNLMLGCYGKATSSEIYLEDDELEACRWCDRAEVQQMIDGTHPNGDKIPLSISIAYQLITDWMDGRIS